MINKESSGSPFFVMPVFSGSWRLNATLAAKTRKLKSLRKESDKVTQEAKRENKSFIIKGRGSSVVEQPIRKLRQRHLNKRPS